jgi:hypothetical protein
MEGEKSGVKNTLPRNLHHTAREERAKDHSKAGNDQDRSVARRTSAQSGSQKVNGIISHSDHQVKGRYRQQQYNEQKVRIQ